MHRCKSCPRQKIVKYKIKKGSIEKLKYQRGLKRKKIISA